MTTARGQGGRAVGAGGWGRPQALALCGSPSPGTGAAVGKAKPTRFVQPTPLSSVLNRVVTGNPSSLLCTLEANGRVYLINPNGIPVGADATINAGSGGAVTFGSGTSGVVGIVDATNSLIGSTSYDYVGNGGITALSNGNYVVRSPNWESRDFSQLFTTILEPADPYEENQLPGTVPFSVLEEEELKRIRYQKALRASPPDWAAFQARRSSQTNTETIPIPPRHDAQTCLLRSVE